jgi:histidinol-phosphate/aromatic aminotransferase/cobyric acid decarboxylase-like protein
MFKLGDKAQLSGGSEIRGIDEIERCIRESVGTKEAATKFIEALRHAVLVEKDDETARRANAGD